MKKDAKQTPAVDSRAARLKSALKANIARRKAQAMARSGKDTGPSRDGNDDKR